MSNRRRLRPGPYRLRESTATLAPGDTLTIDLADVAPPEQLESVRPSRIELCETFTEARSEPVGPDGSAQLVQIIDAGWGSSGFYSPEVLAEAGRQQVFKAGTHLYIDHPTETEDIERPERSVRDLAAVLAEDAYYDPQRRALVGRTRVFADYRELLFEKRDHIGLSIRASGVSEYGEAEGRKGVVVTAITEALSVDYVTKAGRGGKVLALLESARTNMREARSLGAWLESRLHLTLTQYADEMYGDGRLSRDERIVLSGAIGDALQVWTARVEQDAPQLFQRDLYDDPGPTQAAVAESDVEASSQVTPDGLVRVAHIPILPDPSLDEVPPPDPVPAVPATDVTDGAKPAAPTNPTESEDPMSGTQTGTPPVTAGTATAAEAPTISAEARVEIAAAQLAEAQSRITALESQNATLTAERDTASGELRRMRNVEAARGVCTSALATHTDLADPTRARITEAVTRDVPTTQTGEVDTAALTAAIGRHVESERAYIASIREAAGEGTPTGLGGSTGAPNPGDIGAFHGQVEQRMRNFGLNESAARSAAIGR